MADAFDTAASDIEAQRRAAVAAIASGGSAGANAMANAQSQIASSRSAALNAALADSAARGITPAQQQEFAGTIGRPYDLLYSATGASAASRAAENAAIQGSADNYFRQLSAAVPVARMSLQQAIARAQAKAQQNMSDSELRTRLLGAGQNEQEQAIQDALHGHHQAQTQYEALQHLLNTYVANHPYGSTTQATQTGALGPVGPQGKNGPVVSQQDKDTIDRLEAQIAQARQARDLTTQAVAQSQKATPEDYARQAGIQSGLDPDLVAGLIPQKAAKPNPQALVAPISDAARQVGIDDKTLKSILAPAADGTESWFQKAAAAAQAAIKDGVPLSTFTKDLNTNVPRKLGRTKALILAIYGPAFQG